MKHSWMIIGLMLASLSVHGMLSDDELREMERLVKIDGVRDSEEGSDEQRRHELRIDFSSETEGMSGIYIRVAVELTDRKTKQVYRVEEMGKFGDLLAIHHDDYQGEGRWELHMPCGELDKLKVTAYVVQFGVIDADAFVPLQTECDHVGSYDELMDRAAEEFPNPCKLLLTVMVDR